ncbi:hypothetical protein G9C85_11835 [Halorubellus sp. JP-L1]|uniref:DUF7314 family protein n=1 Tax=Halorubellus sp. JP-L1 TaxID=2715753 RepID=UPI00140E04E8|nr:hypothetical protein [Halorubellus sp. JP-L1]NHN42311.1 hypothetical protein [Halorubellus sp. JP-L1]
MADEFAKGTAILTGVGLVWMVLAGWYKTPSFEGAQLTGAPPGDPGMWGEMALVLESGLRWFIIIGVLTFWIVIPAAEQTREHFAS